MFWFGRGISLKDYLIAAVGSHLGSQRSPSSMGGGAEIFPDWSERDARIPRVVLNGCGAEPAASFAAAQSPAKRAFLTANPWDPS